MGRDSRLVKRNLFVLPGGLLAVVAAIGLVYFLAVRKTGAPCVKYTAVQLSGACYTMTMPLAGLLLIGLILVAVGLFVFRGKPESLVDHLHHGTPAHFGLALLGALVAIPVLAYAVVLFLERARNTTYVMKVPGSASNPPAVMTLHAVLGVVLLLGLLAFIPYLILFLSQGLLRRRFLAAADNYEDPDAFPGEPGGPAALATDAASAGAMQLAPPEEFVDEALWPASRDGPEVEAAPPGVPDSDVWTPVPMAPPVAPAGAVAIAKRRTAPAVQPAPMVRQAPGCRAMNSAGLECGDPVGPGGRYCLRHACQGRTASGSPCRNPALEGGSRCRAHAPS